MTGPTPLPALPPARGAGQYRVTVVCTGNICRSPTADVVLNTLLAEAGLGRAVSVDSSGLAGWHVGEGMDQRSAAHLARAGYDPGRHRVRQISPGWHERYDLVLAMDEGHRRDLRAQAGRAGADEADLARIRLFGDFDPVDPGGEVPDPYYGGDLGFQEVLTMVERTSGAIVAALEREHAPR